MEKHRWEKAYPEGLSWSEPPPPPVALESWLLQAATAWRDRPAIDFYDAVLTFGKLRDQAERLATALQAIGVEPGVQVGLFLPNTPHFIVSFFAILMAGGRVVNFSPVMGLRAFEAQLEDSQARVVIAADWVPLYSEMSSARGVDRLSAVIVCSLTDYLEPGVAAGLVGPTPRHRERNELSFAELLASGGALRAPDHGKLEEEVAVLQYTGGTTGDPKGAMLTHGNFSAVVSIGERLLRRQRRGANHPLNVLCVLPIAHIFGLSVMLRCIAYGMQMVLHMRFDAARVLADVERKGIHVFSAVPAMYSAMVNHGKFKEANLSSVRGFGSAGAPLPVELRRQFEEGGQRRLMEGYGLTETTGLGTFSVSEEPRRPGAVGLPAPCTVIEAVDLETGMTLPPGEVGELCISGPQVMAGYWNRPTENEEAFRGGHFHTGDIGLVDEKGIVVLVDRKKEIIFTGGQNVYPRNIERAIYELQAVSEVAVVGVPHPILGEVAKAFIVLKPGTSVFTYGELYSFLRKRLGPYELPVAMEIRERLPVTGAGKVAKRDLLAEELARQGT